VSHARSYRLQTDDVLEDPARSELRRVRRVRRSVLGPAVATPASFCFRTARRKRAPMSSLRVFEAARPARLHFPRPALPRRTITRASESRGEAARRVGATASLRDVCSVCTQRSAPLASSRIARSSPTIPGMRGRSLTAFAAPFRAGLRSGSPGRSPPGSTQPPCQTPAARPALTRCVRAVSPFAPYGLTPALSALSVAAAQTARRRTRNRLMCWTRALLLLDARRWILSGTVARVPRAEGAREARGTRA
jgi:hypothetical protein